MAEIIEKKYAVDNTQKVYVEEYDKWTTVLDDFTSSDSSISYRVFQLKVWEVLLQA